MTRAALRFLGLCLGATVFLSFAALSSCDPFSPTYKDLQCGVGESCPSGMDCHRNVCVSEICGDGIIVGDEVCDDGNQVDGDGCEARCNAASCYVPVTHATITSGLADQACSTLYVHAGVYAERLTLSRPLTLVGVGDLPPILDGGAAGTVLTVDLGITATVRNFTITNGKAATGGGVLNRGTLTLDTVTVTENLASGELPGGGGIANLGGDLSLSATTVSKNRLEATGAPNAMRGAGISSAGGAVRLDGASTVEENTIAVAGRTGYPGQGAGISAINTALALVGASAVRGNTITIEGSSGGGGGADAFGAGLHVSAGSLTINGDSVIEDNAISVKGSGRSGAASAVGEAGGFFVVGGAVTFDGAIIRNNKVMAESVDSAFATSGGGQIRNASINLKNALFTGNTVRSDGTAATATALARVGALGLYAVTGTISDSRFTANTVTAESKATDLSVFVFASAAGVEIAERGAVTLQRCTIDGNTASATTPSGSASAAGLSTEVYTGQAIVLNVNLVACTVSNNLTQGPRLARGAGVAAIASTGDTQLNLTIVNSTISGNRVDSPAGLARGAGLYAETSTGQARVNLMLASTTITDNRATGMSPSAGGMYLFKGISAANTTMRIRNTIVADNVAASAPDCLNGDATLSSDGFNLFGVPGNCTLANPSGERTGAAMLAPLADNGGPTRTHAPTAASQVVNGGPQLACSDPLNVAIPLAMDQRGLARVVGGRCDLGSYEVQ